MKKYTTAPAKGFTLVELIVVIVILAILATIAFLSFSSQSASARDSKRKTDLSNIASKINIGAANGSKLTDFVSDTSSEIASIILGGTGKTAGGYTYAAGNINFNMLGVNAADFADPITKGSYKVGATSAVGGVFQLASRLENDENGNTTTSGAFLVGNYSARGVSATHTATGTYKAADKSLTLSTNVGVFKSGDSLKNAAGVVCKATSVSADMSIIKFSTCSIAADATTTWTLEAPETDGLIKSLENPSAGVKSTGGTTPY